MSVPAAIAAVSVEVCDLELCHVRLMNDARYPWLVLVPRRPDAVEISEASNSSASSPTESCWSGC